MRNALIVAALLVVAGVAARVTRTEGSVPDSAQAAAPSSVRTAPLPAPSAPPSTLPHDREAFVGSDACKACHRAQSEAYADSHHAKALVRPTSDTEKTHFDAAHFTSELGGTTTFAWRDGAPVVSTPVSGGKTRSFAVRYVSGVWPLEQYVVETERGKLQSLGVVWDSRTADAGGNRWFHVYGPTGIAPNDPLYFTASAQSFNHQCADCHSTFVERRYDVATDRFDTRSTELSVGCEACHGPGAEHVRSARAGKPSPLPARLKASEPWAPSATGSPTPRAQDGAEVEVCAPCHSRRKPLKEGFIANDPFLDSFEPELLRPGRYHADGQVGGEVYEWASFLQSRMYHAGVRCSDCHEPHSGKTYGSGNALCVRCHEPTRFDTEAHSHHPAGKALCIDCHMPPSTFMQIDERRDHSIRIPRPDRSVELGTPNACNGCHTKQPATWARDAAARWFPGLSARPHFGEALAKDQKGTLDAPRALRTLVEDGSAPAIARATALERLGSYPTEATPRALRAALAGPEPLVTYGSVLGTARLPQQQRVPLLLPVLEHRIRAVRVAAAKALAGVRLEELPPSARPSLERAFAEVEASFDVSASQPQTHVERSAFELARGRLTDAAAALDTALRLEPCLAEALLNRAELERRRSNEPAAEHAIQAALACSPQNAAAHHALGLWQVRAHQADAAIRSFRKAVELAPADPRFGYVLAVALAGNGERDEAIRVLEAALAHRPNDADLLRALERYLHESGRIERATETTRVLEELLRR